jgi:hypothetical protein
MRVWADVYNSSGTLVGGPITSLTGASVTRALDGAGSISLTFPAADERAVSLLQNERRVRLYVEHDEQTRELGRGIVRQLRANVGESSITFSASGPDSLDVLARRSVLLNRAYENLSVSDIANDLASLAGWTAEVDFGTGNQTCRFDGSNVLKALLRVAEEKGLHLREGESDNTLEIGAFGTDTGVICMAPQALTRSLYGNDDLILIDSITQTTDSKDICNWIVPIGAGEGAAAMTLRYSNRLGTYAIEQVLGPDGQTLYYLRHTDSIAMYGQCERVVTFKEIGPVANSTTAKQLAANALYDAAVAWLERQAVPLTTYKISGRKCRTTIRPGDKVRVVYAGVVETQEGDYTPIAVDELMWVMKVTETVSADGLRLSLDVATVDRREQDTAQAVVGALDAINVRNVSVQTFPYTFENVYYDTIAANYKDATFRFRVTDYVTDLISVKINFRTHPLWTPATYFALTPPEFNWELRVSPNYPSGVSLWIDGVDVSSGYGGPWLNSSENQQLEIEADITQLILDSAGGIYQEHSIVLKCTQRFGAVEVYSPLRSNNGASTGMVEMAIYALGTARAVVPS